MYVIDFCVGISETPKQNVELMDLIALPTRIMPTGPGGHGHGCGSGRGWLPSHHFTSPETIKFVKEVGESLEKKEKIKEEKKVFVKRHCYRKQREIGLLKKLKLEGEL